ncbi:MAG: hypothetical protein JNK74_05350 [Candidatus Hydrogenedentes bacterium]|nr:hypothetical protein [Candidatus Hydrogenedentota bacterium]
MSTPLKQFRDQYRETLLNFLWREWTALGVAGTDATPPRHVSDPEALLLFTCTLGRHDQRLFDEVMDWLLKNGRFINIQRLRNILAKEDFRGGPVLSAIADWLTTQGASSKWKLLAKRPAKIDPTPPVGVQERQPSTKKPEPADESSSHAPNSRVQEEPEFAINYPLSTINSLFFLPNGRPMPPSKKQDPLFLQHGFQRNPLMPRGYSRPFPADAPAARLLKLRALFGVNARCEILDYLARNGTGHPREIARELYYSQKSVHDTMADLACSGVIQSSKGARERIYRLSVGNLPFLDRDASEMDWINWPVLLSAAERVWHLVEELSAEDLEPRVLESEIGLVMGPVFEKLNRARWMTALAGSHSSGGILPLGYFHSAFKALMTR